MKVCLISRYFTTDKREGVGIGRVSGKILKGLMEEGLDVWPIHTEGSGLPSYFWYTYMGIPMKLFKADIYHALTPMEGIWIPREKSVVTYHDLFQVTNPELVGGGMGYSKFKLEFGRRYFEWACRKASECRRIVCVSQKTMGEVIDIFGVDKGKVRVIRSGINPNLEPGLKRDTILRIGYLGMLDKRKRVDLLIKAFVRSGLDAELVIGGRGLDEAYLWSLIGDGNVGFAGHIPDSGLSSFYNSLTVFVFPTSIEGYGLPIVEAMACKKPVVVLSDALIPDEVKNRCIVVENLDMLFSNQNYLEGRIASVDIGGNYKWAKTHDWKTTIKEYIEVYQEVLDG